MVCNPARCELDACLVNWKVTEVIAYFYMCIKILLSTRLGFSSCMCVPSGHVSERGPSVSGDQ